MNNFNIQFDLHRLEHFASLIEFPDFVTLIRERRFTQETCGNPQFHVHVLVCTSKSHMTISVLNFKV